MNLASAFSSFGSWPSWRWTRRNIAWIGGLFIASLIAMGAYDIHRSYHVTVDGIGRELDTNARVLAEQTARSIQAVDVILRHIEQQYQRGLLPSKREELRAYLRDQAVGLVQVDGLLVTRPDGSLRGSSYIDLAQEPGVSLTGQVGFDMAKGKGFTGLFVDIARRSTVDGGWMFPLVRRLEARGGEFAGAVAARGRIDYFQHVYRNVRLDTGTHVTLMHQNGRVIARDPPFDAVMGQRLPNFDDMVSAYHARDELPLRITSGVDGVERFAALQLVPDYPLAVVVTKDVSLALAPWREQTLGAAGRMLALSFAALLLLIALIRQLSHVYLTRESLAASEERFALAVAGSNDGILDWDIVNDRMFTSERAKLIAGVQAGGTLWTRDQWLSVLKIHPEDAARHAEDFRRHLEGKSQLREGEYRVGHPDGSWRWVLVRGTCVRDAQGKAVRWAGSVTDINRRKLAEEALRESEQRFALAVQASDHGIVDYDLVHDRMYSSERAMQILGVQSDVTTRTLVEWESLVRLHPDDRERHHQGLHDFLHGRSDVNEGEFRVLQPDGRYRWVHMRVGCVRDEAGKLIRWAGSVNDIDDRKRAEEALRESEQRFALAVAGADDGIWYQDYTTREVFVSARSRQLAGLPPGPEVMPMDEWFELLDGQIHPEDRPRRDAAMAAHMAGASAIFESEHREHQPDGSWRWVRVRGACVRDEQGRPLRMAGSVTDIDAQKRAELERSRLEGQLLQAKKLEAIGTLAGGIAHDFNNILAAILGYGEMARGHAKEGTALRRHVEAVVSAGMRAKSLVERILAFSRSGIGERKPVHVQAVVAEALDLLAASVPATLTIERHLHSGEAAVMGDPTQIHQVAMNLCTNAAQAMKNQGTLSITLDVVEKERSLLATNTLAAGRYVRLQVGDTGTGIAPQVLERLFDPFFTTKDVGVGTGLGLSLVHGIVTDLGGGIEVDSRPGQGTVFTVYLPLSYEAIAAADIEETVPAGQGETVLLVDDEESLVRLGEEMIAELGYEPVGYTSSVAALEAFRADPGRFAAVLSDESMPEMTGLELAAQLRAIRADLPIVIMSGFVTPALAARAKELGVAEVRAKPLVSREIARSLANALRREE